MTAWNIVFQLNRASRKSVSREDGGMKASVERGSATLRVTGVETVTDNEARKSAESFANPLLDALAMGYGEALMIEGPDWNSETLNPDGSKSIRVRVSGNMTMSSSLTTKHFDAKGNLLGEYDSENLGTIPVADSRARSYYRQALLSSDPFDEFRNLYLACENVAAKVRRHTRTKGTTPLEQAIDTCFSGARLTELSAQIPAACPVSNDQSVADAVASYLTDIRNQLNHSRMTDSKVPYDRRDEEAVRTAMPLLQFVTEALMDFEEAQGLEGEPANG